MNLHTNNETDFGWDLPSIPSEKKRAKVSENWRELLETSLRVRYRGTNAL